MIKRMVCVDNTGIVDFAGDILKQKCEELVVYDDDPTSEEETCARIGDADAVLVSWRTKISANVLKKSPNIRYVGMCCSLYNENSSNVDIAQARRQGIVVKGCYHYGDDGVVLFILSALAELCTGMYGMLLFEEPVEFEGLKIGLVGMGATGRKVAQGLVHLGAEIYYTAHASVESVPYTFLPLDELIDTCKVISIHVPRNTIILNKREFDRMNGKVLINTSLGYTFDKDAFDQWILLKNNYAIFDTNAVTPEFKVQYEDAANVITNAYVCGFTRNARERLAHKVVENLDAFLKHE